MLHSQWRHLTNRLVSTRNVTHGLCKQTPLPDHSRQQKTRSETNCRWTRRILSTHLSPAFLVNAEDSAISSLTARTATQQDDMMAREGGHYAAYRLVARSLRKHSPRPPAPPTNYPCVLTMFLNKFYNLESWQISLAPLFILLPHIILPLNILTFYWLTHFKRSIEVG